MTSGIRETFQNISHLCFLDRIKSKFSYLTVISGVSSFESFPTAYTQLIVHVMEDSPHLFGHLELHDLPRVHHDVRRPLLRDANEAVAVNLEKLVAGLRGGSKN